MTETAHAVRPLQGIRVLDLSSFISGPFCTTQLAEFGAEVIKVELPGVGDAFRRFGTPSRSGDSLIYLSEQRNKKSITLDLRKSEGAEILKQLAADMDVLVENFQTGTLEKWGLGWDVLSALNPRLVMVRITGYGQTGPYRDRPGFGRIANAFGGLSFLAGYPDRPPVTPGSATIPDYLTGIYGAYGAVLALRARDITGKGQVIDIGLYEPVFRILDELAVAYHYTGRVRQRMGPGTVNAVPHSHYPTKDDRWVAIACTTDKIFERLAQAMGRPEVAGGGKYGTLKQRSEHRQEVDDFVTSWTRSLDRAQVLEICEAHQVPCGPLYAIDEIFGDPQYRARENILFVNDPRAGEVAVPNVVPRLSETPGGLDWLGPPLGAHNQEILGDRLGLDAARLAELKSKGVI
ncbi:MAG TPA: CaiB/BaiF CoA-transferase family protein [Stellaceae bacterium]|nr:CaiB/BaiF CoA-transferase family protein [Stellaceae bacterium]